MKKRIVLVARQGGYGGAYYLNKAINQCSLIYESELVVSEHDVYDFGDGTIIHKDNIDYIDDLFNSADIVFLCDITGIHAICRYLSFVHGKKLIGKMKKSTICGYLKNKILSNWLKKRKTVFYWTGSIYRGKYDCINEWAKDINPKCIFSMCDLIRFNENAMPLMQTYDISIFPVLEKKNKITVTH
jgi:hypothetical protein